MPTYGPYMTTDTGFMILKRVQDTALPVVEKEWGERKGAPAFHSVGGHLPLALCCRGEGAKHLAVDAMKLACCGALVCGVDPCRSATHHRLHTSCFVCGTRLAGDAFDALNTATEARRIINAVLWAAAAASDARTQAETETKQETKESKETRPDRITVRASNPQHKTPAITQDRPPPDGDEMWEYHSMF